MTRANDEYISLSERRDMIYSVNPAAVVQIHVDASLDPKQSGWSLLYNENSTDLATEIYEMAHPIFEAESINLVKASWYTSNYWFTSYNIGTTPIVIIECGFITNAGDRERLQDDNFINTILSLVADALTAVRT